MAKKTHRIIRIELENPKYLFVLIGISEADLTEIKLSHKQKKFKLTHGGKEIPMYKLIGIIGKTEEFTTYLVSQIEEFGKVKEVMLTTGLNKRAASRLTKKVIPRYMRLLEGDHAILMRIPMGKIDNYRKVLGVCYAKLEL